MNRFNIQQNAAVIASCEETRGLMSISDLKGPVVCPKPRRVGIVANGPLRPPRLNLSHQTEMYASKAGSELLDLILKKEGDAGELYGSPVASSPPYFCGSPPTRAANPVIRDARFGDEKSTPNFPLPLPSTSSGLLSPSSSARMGGCTRMSFGLKPAAVRVEGFDCLNRDRQNSSIPAMA